MNKTFLFFLVVFFLSSLNCFSQDMPIGYWRSHLPYNNTVSAATDGITLFCASSESFFTYNVAHNEITTYSKAEGMADVGVAHIGYDAVNDYVILVYTNGNIDLFKDETFFNIPDIKRKSISPKNINHIYIENGTAYLSTGFGIVVLNLQKKETKETYSFINNNKTAEVKSLTSMGDFFYAVTTDGLYKANKNHPNLQAFSAWQKLTLHTNLSSAVTANNTVYLSNNDSLFYLHADTLRFVYESPYQINRLDAAANKIYINEYNAQTFNGQIKILNAPDNQIADSFFVPGNPANTLQLSDNSIWVADRHQGLGKRNAQNSMDYTTPNGPASPAAFDILPYNGDVWIAHGGYDENWTYTYNRSGLSHLQNNKWKTYTNRNFPLLSNVTDFIVLAKDPVDGTLYAGSFKDGLLILRENGNNEFHTGSANPYVEPHYIDTGSYRVAGITLDLNGNLWINNAGATKELTLKTKDGNTHKYIGAGTRTYSAGILADDNNLKWYFLPVKGDGVAVYDDNQTPENPNDDRMARISASQYALGYINCIAKDKTNAIWIGTNDGIGVINCTSDQIFSGQCDIRKPIVQYDQFPGFLFQNEKVRTIAVDGANRKWIGTTNGVWLISSDGDKIINRFTAENSPLPANDVRKIAVDPITGDVYIGTAAGLVSYRGTATEGGETNQTVTTFPNPIPSGYSGTIAIRGLVENADVRITDISGQLVYRTRAFGGQAVWNGVDYNGRKPQSGVYLIFVTNKDGSQTHAGKMVFME